MIKKFNQYNESLRDKMKPKSEEEIDHAIKNAPIEKLLDIISSGKISKDKIPSIQEIKERLKSEEPLNRWIYLTTDKKSLGKYYPDEKEIEDGLKKLPMIEWINTVYYKNLGDKFYPTDKELEEAIKGDGKDKIYHVWSGLDAFEFKTKDGEKIYFPYISVIATSEIDAQMKAAKTVGQDLMTQYTDRANNIGYENFVGSVDYQREF